MSSVELAFTSGMVAIRVISLLALIGVVLDCVESLATRRLYADDGIFSWAVNRAESGDRPSALHEFLSRCDFSYLVAVEMVLAFIAILLGNGYSAWPITGIILIRIALIARNGYHGTEGADHMLMLVLVAIVLYFIAPGYLAKESVLWFLCAQTLLAYVIAGVVKARHPSWIKGTSMSSILSTVLFGHPFFARIFSRHPRLGPITCWSVIAFEFSCPILVLTSLKGCLVFIALAICFHLAIAVVQGLNLFVWAFFSTYPALFITSYDLHKYLRAH